MIQFFQVVEVILRDYQCRVVRAIGSTKTGTQQSAVTLQVIQICSTRNRDGTIVITTARSVEDETRNAELNGNRNPECWGDFSQLVKIEKIKYLGMSWYKVELRF